MHFTCNHACASDLSTVNLFLCFTCNKLVIRSMAENKYYNHCYITQYYYSFNWSLYNKRVVNWRTVIYCG